MFPLMSPKEKWLINGPEPAHKAAVRVHGQKAGVRIGVIRASRLVGPGADVGLLVGPLLSKHPRLKALVRGLRRSLRCQGVYKQ